MNTTARAGVGAVAVVALLTLVFGTRETASAQGGMGGEVQCTADCLADTGIGASGQWVLLLLSQADGNGTDPSCVTCESCQSQVYYAYVGSGMYGITFSNGATAAGSGGVSGNDNLTTGCDSDAPGTFSGFDSSGGTAVAILHCPCQA